MCCLRVGLSIFFSFLFKGFCDLWEIAKLCLEMLLFLSARQPLSLRRKTLATRVCWLEFACCEQGCVGVSCLSQKVTKKLYKCQHLFLMISCCSHLFTYPTVISHNPAKLREELNEAHIPIFPFLKATLTASFVFCRSELVHLQACKFAVCQLLSCSLWTGKSIPNSVSHCCPL